MKTIEHNIPECVVGAFYPEGVENFRTVSGGLVNQTVLAKEKNGKQSILQGLSPIFDERIAKDFSVVSNHLESEGWEVPIALKTPDDEPLYRDNTGKMWRAFSYIESDDAPPPISIENAIGMSGLLGSLHGSLKKLQYKPAFAIPNFHDTTHYAEKLGTVIARLPDLERKNAKKMIALAQELSPNKDAHQLIHGDPKTTNVLYRSGNPFTFIDYDTIMNGDPLIDVGDMLRSLTGKLLVGRSFQGSMIDPVIDAYVETAQCPESPNAFNKQARCAAKLITMELGMRYYIDAVEQSYFSWDSANYDSATEHNIIRANNQWAVYEALEG